eukprot:PhM_4_TR15684/c0_g1_i2/m.900
MQLEAMAVAQLAHAVHVVHGQHTAAKHVVRVLESHYTRDGEVHVLDLPDLCVDLFERHRAVGAGGHLHNLGVAEHTGAADLKLDDVGVVADDGFAGRHAAVHHHRDEVAHGAAHNVQRGLLAEVRGHLTLELLHRRVLIPHIVAAHGLRHGLAHLWRRLRERVGAEVDGALVLVRRCECHGAGVVDATVAVALCLSAGVRVSVMMVALAWRGHVVLLNKTSEVGQTLAATCTIHRVLFLRRGTSELLDAHRALLRCVRAALLVLGSLCLGLGTHALEVGHRRWWRWHHNFWAQCRGPHRWVEAAGLHLGVLVLVGWMVHCLTVLASHCF